MPKPEELRRRSIRLCGYDYSEEGAYFITLCAHNREMVFEDEGYRKIVEKYWFALPRHYPHVELDEYVLMPNHIHGIIVLVGAGSNGRTANTVRPDKPALSQSGAVADSKTAPPPHGAGLAGLRPDEPAPTIQIPKRHPLSEIVRFFKRNSARGINRLRRTPGLPI